MSASPGRVDDALPELRRQWWAVAGLAVLLLMGGAALLAQAWDGGIALRWGLLAGLTLAFELWLFRRALPDNRRDASAALRPDLGFPNWITLFRGLAAAGLTGLLAVPAPSAALVWLPALLHAAVILPDPLDGALARRSGRTSLLGMHLDMEYDSIGMLAGTLLVVRLGHVPWWFALVGLARYLYVAALWWHRRRGLPVDDLTHSTVRRVVAGLMMGFVNVALWPVSEVRLVTLAAVLLSVPHLGGFARDWLVVSGAVDPAGPVYRRLHAAYQRALYLVMPVLRILGAGIAIAYFAPSLWRETGLIALAVAVAVAGLFLGIGAGARLAALALLIVLAVNTLLRGAQPRSALLIIAALPVLLYGPGALAIWPVDEPLFTRRA